MSQEDSKSSVESDGEEPKNAARGGEPNGPQTNVERLIAHLPEDSLAAKLVTAYVNPGETTPDAAVAKITATRLHELKQGYGNSED